MVFSLLTIVTFGLVSMSLVGLQYFMLQGNRAGFSRSWTRGSLIIFLVIIVSVHIAHKHIHDNELVCNSRVGSEHGIIIIAQRAHFVGRFAHSGWGCNVRVMGTINRNRTGSEQDTLEAIISRALFTFHIDSLWQIVAYVVNTFLLIRAQVGPWYKWVWYANHKVRIVWNLFTVTLVRKVVAVRSECACDSTEATGSAPNDREGNRWHRTLIDGLRAYSRHAFALWT